MLIFTLGLAQLSRFVPGPALLAAGLYPFVLGDVTKALLAAGVFPAAWSLTRRFTGRA